MIRSKKEYLEYLEEDKIALEIDIRNWKDRLREWVMPHYMWGFQKKLRRLEYYKNCKTGVFNNIYYFYQKHRFRQESIKLGFTIPVNVFESGLAIFHYGTIVVHSHAKVGKNCRLGACVYIGSSRGETKAPQIGDNVYIGPGAKIFGNIKIGNNIAIGDNSSVNKSFDENDIFIAGVPAKKIKDFDITRIINQRKHKTSL